MKKSNLNNKGFSLVELIIVIAIMAILIGVMAPNLMRFIERTRVSSDVQVLEGVRSAIQIALMDPSIPEAEKTAFRGACGTATAAGVDVAVSLAAAPGILREVATSLDLASNSTAAVVTANLIGRLRSNGADSGEIQARTYGINENNVTVRVTNTDKFAANTAAVNRSSGTFIMVVDDAAALLVWD